MQSSRPIDKIFTLSNCALSSQDSPEDELTALVAKIPDVQYLANKYPASPPATSESDTRNLIYQAQRLDNELSSWAARISATWFYAAASDISTPVGSEFAPAQIHRYPDIYTARVWNFYRVSRLVVQSILLRAIRQIPALTESPQAESYRISIERKHVDLVDGICASVPFLLGRDLSKMKLPSANGGRKRERLEGTRLLDDATDDGLRRDGRYSLLWPLYVASSALPIAKTQREWMRSQLRLIAEHGELQARWLCDTDSRILLGGTEAFGFDCV